MQPISHFASGISLASSFSQFLLQGSIEGVSAFSIPCGNDVHIPSKRVCEDA
jgi:hypothetical protein